MFATKDNSVYIEKVTQQDAGDTNWEKLSNTVVYYTPKEISMSPETTNTTIYTKNNINPNTKIKMIEHSSNNIVYLTATSINKGIYNDTDPFNDGSCVAYLRLDYNYIDLTGNFHPSTNGTLNFVTGKFDRAVYSDNNGQITIGRVSTNSDVITVSAWLKWNGHNSCMPLGFERYDIWFYSNNMGFNTSNGDLFGVSSAIDWNVFHHFVFEFHTGEYGKMWLDGAPQSLSQKVGHPAFGYAIIKNKDFHIFGWGATTGYRGFGAVDHVRVFNRHLTDNEISMLYQHELTQIDISSANLSNAPDKVFFDQKPQIFADISTSTTMNFTELDFVSETYANSKFEATYGDLIKSGRYIQRKIIAPEGMEIFPPLSSDVYKDG